jgi:hypothetical protein
MDLQITSSAFIGGFDNCADFAEKMVGGIGIEPMTPPV